LHFLYYLLIDNVVDNYKTQISRDYSIIIVSTAPIRKRCNINELAGIKVERIQSFTE
jgi:cell division transport system permease protein